MLNKNSYLQDFAARAASGFSTAAGALALSVWLCAPAAAQFFFEPRPQPGFQLFGPWGPPEPPKPPADYSRAPAPKKPETPPAATIVVMGDSMADWLAYGLEDAFSDTPEIGIIRKHRAYSGLIRYESRGDLDWPRVARDILAAEKPSAVVMMLGLSDRQAIRERPAPKGAPAPQEQEQQADPDNPDLQITAPEPQRSAGGTFEFRSERWAELYAKKIDDTIAALKSRGIPVIWVGLPVVRGPKATADTAYLNDIFRAQAEKNGIIFVDVWDGFVDEAGKFSYQGPDVDGQIRRLRTPDGVYFTKYGARKLAHYVEREIRRVGIRALPVALPADEPMQQPSAISRPTGPAARPIAGAIVPLTAAAVSGSDELLGGGGSRTLATDPIATRVLVKGEPINAPKGRADDFVWPPGGSAAASPAGNPADPPSAMVAPESPPAPAAPAPDRDAGKNAVPASKPASRPERAAAESERSTSSAGQAPAKKPPPPASAATRDVPRPPAPIPFTWFR